MIFDHAHEWNESKKNVIYLWDLFESGTNFDQLEDVVSVGGVLKSDGDLKLK